MDDFGVLSRWLQSSANRAEVRAARAQFSPLLLVVGGEMDEASAAGPAQGHVLAYLRCLYLELERLDALAARRLRCLGNDGRL